MISCAYIPSYPLMRLAPDEVKCTESVGDLGVCGEGIEKTQFCLKSLGSDNELDPKSCIKRLGTRRHRAKTPRVFS